LLQGVSEVQKYACLDCLRWFTTGKTEEFCGFRLRRGAVVSGILHNCRFR
jgi:hypothetical protein